MNKKRLALLNALIDFHLDDGTDAALGEEEFEKILHIINPTVGELEAAGVPGRYSDERQDVVKVVESLFYLHHTSISPIDRSMLIMLLDKVDPTYDELAAGLDYSHSVAGQYYRDIMSRRIHKDEERAWLLVHSIVANKYEQCGVEHMGDRRGAEVATNFINQLYMDVNNPHEDV